MQICRSYPSMPTDKDIPFDSFAVIRMSNLNSHTLPDGGLIFVVFTSSMVYVNTEGDFIECNGVFSIL